MSYIEPPIEAPKESSSKEKIGDISEELNRLRKRISDHIEENHTRRIFSDLASDRRSFDPLLAAHLVILLRKMSDAERLATMNEMVRMVHDVTSQYDPSTASYMRNEFEINIDALIKHAFSEGVLSVSQCAEGLVMTTDFTHPSKINQAKWRFVKDCIPSMDYKGVRNLFRYIVDSQFSKLPLTLPPDKVSELGVVEEILLMIVDREANLIPPIFTIVEIGKGISKQVYLFPRLAHTLSQLCIFFRPVADLSNVIGRSFLFPVPQHPTFLVTATSWRVEGYNSLISTRFQNQYLPYREEHFTPQTFLLYMVLRQPRGKDYIATLTKSWTKMKSQWDVLLSVLICEVMAEVEQLEENDPIPRYQWENILSIVHQSIHIQNLNVVRFLEVLRHLVKSTNYKRARDEVMWIVLQITGTFGNTQIFDLAIREIVELYKVLFDGEVSGMGASDHPAQLVRFLAAASTWMILEGKEGLPEPNESLRLHIDFIRRGVENLDGNDMLAVIANAYRSESQVGHMVQGIFQRRLDGMPSEDSMFLLSYGRQATNRLSAFTTEFLDALTYRAKSTLISKCLHSLRSFNTERVPSPAVLDTLARILVSLDYEFGLRQLVAMLQRSLSASLNIDLAKEQSFILFEVMCFRLGAVHLQPQQRYQFNLYILSVMYQHMVMHNHQLYQIIEQTLMRQWSWAPFYDTIHNAAHFLGKSMKANPKNFVFVCPQTFATCPADGKQFPVCPEIFRMFIITLMRAIRITGHEISVSPDDGLYGHLMQNFEWPESMVAWFPSWATAIANPPSLDRQSFMPDIQHRVRSDLAVYRGLTPENYLSYGDTPSSAPSILAVIYLVLLENHDEPLSPEFYKILEKKSAREMVVSTNYLVDFLIAELRDEIENVTTFALMKRTLLAMSMRCHVLPIDRLLLALTLHPTHDHTSHIALYIAHELIVSEDVNERLKFFSQMPRKEHSHSDYIRKIVEYHMHYPELTVMEMLNGAKPIASAHMPSYYGCFPERLLPISDFVISRALEIGFSEALFNRLLQALSPIYKHHPCPLTYVYSTLFVLYGRIKKPQSRVFVLAIHSQAAEEVPLTISYEKFNHQKVSPEFLLLELVSRVSQSLDFVLAPPTFVSTDWKTAEYSPGAQTIYSACVELMASPYSPEVLVTSMINCMLSAPHSRPYNVLNVLSLLLSALPDAFADVLLAEFVGVVESGELEECTFEELVFDTFEESQLLHISTRSSVVNALAQAYWTHCNFTALAKFCPEYVTNLLTRVHTENSFWYSLRLVVPLLQRCYDWPKDKSKHLSEVLHVAGLIIEKIASLVQKGIEFEHPDELCDLLYHMKYVFVGDFLRKQAEENFPKLTPRMRERLKFYASQTETKHEEDASLSLSS